MRKSAVANNVALPVADEQPGIIADPVGDVPGGPPAPHPQPEIDGDLLPPDVEPPLVEPIEPSAKDKLRLEAKSIRHLRDHKPKNFYCDACQQAKLYHRPHGRKKNIGPLPTKFGEQLTADHLVAHSEKSQSLHGEKDAIIIFDRATRWKECYPVPTRSGDHTWTASKDFACGCKVRQLQ